MKSFLAQQSLNKTLSACGLIACTFLISACGPEEDSATADTATNATTLALETEEQKVSYIIGMNMGKNLQQQGLALEADLLARGIKDVMSGAEPQLSQEEMMTTMQAFQEKMMAKQQEDMASQEAERLASAETNKQAGEVFLAENAEKEGVVTTESGLQYKVITAGTGAKPAATDSVTVHYKGTLIDGTEFDSSYGRGEPATFGVDAVIPGWIEALQLMAEGSKWELYIPSELAYGAGGTGGPIGPNAALVFEVELLKIGSPEAKSAIREIGAKPAASDS